MKNIEAIACQHNLRFSYPLGALHASQGLSLGDAERITEGFSKAINVTLPYSMEFYINGKTVYGVDSERLTEENEPVPCDFWGSDRNVLVGYTDAQAIYSLPTEADFDPNLLEVTPQIISINGCQWDGMNVLYDNQELQLRTYCDDEGKNEMLEPEVEELCFVDELGFKIELNVDWL